MAEFTVRGRVAVDSHDAGSGETRVTITRHGALLASGTLARDGSFALGISGGRDVVVTLTATDRRARQIRNIIVGSSDVDLGLLQLDVAEYPPGIAGIAWDVREERPASGGEARLMLGERTLGSARIDDGGVFVLTPPADLPLDDATLRLELDVPSFARVSRPLVISDPTSSVRIGRIALTRATPG